MKKLFLILMVVSLFADLTALAVTPSTAAAINPGKSGGALVGDVLPDSPAAKPGFVKGDVIQEVNRTLVDSIQDFEAGARQGDNQSA